MLLTDKFDEALLRDLLEAVIDPLGTGKPRGPDAAPLTPDVVLRVISGRREALRRFTGAPDLPDGWFHWARYTYLNGLAAYAIDQPSLAADPDLGARFPLLELNSLASQACMELATIIGLG